MIFQSPGGIAHLQCFAKSLIIMHNNGSHTICNQALCLLYLFLNTESCLELSIITLHVLVG